MGVILNKVTFSNNLDLGGLWAGARLAHSPRANLLLVWAGFEKTPRNVFCEVHLADDEILPAFYLTLHFKHGNRFSNIHESQGGRQPLSYIDSQSELPKRALNGVLALDIPAFISLFLNATVVNGSFGESFPPEYTNTTPSHL